MIQTFLFLKKCFKFFKFLFQFFKDGEEHATKLFPKFINSETAIWHHSPHSSHRFIPMLNQDNPDQEFKLIQKDNPDDQLIDLRQARGALLPITRL